MSPSVSTIITISNNGPLLADAMDSVLSQEFGEPMEIIVVDDGSSDDTIEVMAHYLKRQGSVRIQYILQANGGPARARNSGVLAAKGKYIAFLDAGDIWLPGKLKKSLSFMQSHPDIGLLFSDVEQFDERGTFSLSFFRTRRCRAELSRDWERLKDPFRLTLRECVILLSASVIRADCFKSIGLFDEDLVSGEDMDLLLRLSANYPVACLPEVLVGKRSSERNFSGGRVAAMRAIINVLDRMELSHPDLMRKHRDTVNQQRAEVHAEAGYHLFEARDFKLAFGHSLSGLRYRPKAKGVYYTGMSFLGICLGPQVFSRLRTLKRTFSGEKPRKPSETRAAAVQGKD